MENAAHSTRTEARIIHLRTPEIPIPSNQTKVHQPSIMDRYVLEYIDQLLDEHFT